MRVFAGPNGSGKSTIIDDIRRYKTKDGSIDFGIYVNADDIARKLEGNGCSLTKYEIKTTNQEFSEIALASGLVGEIFTQETFRSCYSLKNNKVVLKDQAQKDRLAQIIADFLRKKLIRERKKLSFETVFSHSGKVEIMRLAKDSGYKVYLYFVSTESPEINKYRVAIRVAKGGHNVPEQLIENRYFRSLDLLYPASQLCYQAFFYDNSADGKPANLINHFKIIKGKKNWDKKLKEKDAPEWFIKYYAKKIKKKRNQARD